MHRKMENSLQNPAPKSSIFFFHSIFVKLIVFMFLLFVLHQYPLKFKENKGTSPSVNSKLWEFFYLLVVGVVGSYGLFSGPCERNESEVNEILDENVMGFENGMGFENVVECDEKKMLKRSDLEQFGASGSDNLGDFDEKMAKRWNFDEISVLGNGDYVGNRCESSRNGVEKEDFGESLGLGLMDDFKIGMEDKAGLPNRSLGSKNLDSKAVESSDDLGDCVSDSESSKDCSEKMKRKRFRGLLPINLEDKFNEARTASLIPSHIGTGRFEDEPGEIDRKADEFIAKIKKQMRLQRISSAKRRQFGYKL